jgi:hypothetical protein
MGGDRRAAARGRRRGGRREPLERGEQARVAGVEHGGVRARLGCAVNELPQEHRQDGGKER